MTRIMVIAGTADARSIIAELLNSGNHVFATVTTGYGKELLDAHHNLEVYQGRLDAEGMAGVIRDKTIYCMVDASHPFAREASVNAIDACSKAGVPYLRYERKSICSETASVIRVKSFEEAALAAEKVPGNIFLAIGSNNIKYFTDRIQDFKKRLIVRILPVGGMVLKCEEAGLAAGNIIAVKGPFSLEMNMEMLKHYNAAVMVTKESGETGGTAEKLEAAARLGIPVIMVERPEIDYGKKVSSVEEVLEFVKSGEGNDR